MAQSTKPNLGTPLINGRYTSVKPTDVELEKIAIIPGQRAGIPRIGSEHPEAIEARESAKRWAEKRNKRGAK